jgi:dipeptidyl aminopeptidase/acylaminoacyl peptidase
MISTLLGPPTARKSPSPASPNRRDTEIFVMNADGSGQTNLTNNPAQDGSPDWSPDGTKIAFTSNRRSGVTYDIVVMNADGSGQTEVTTDPADDVDPNWSPDGKRIAFARFGGNVDIFVMNADGSGQRNLTDDGSNDRGPAWSPDGKKIAFTSNGEGDNLDIFVMNVDGTARRNLTNNAAQDLDPNWQALPPPPPPRVRCVVPRVIGKRLPAARAQIGRAHCRVGRVRRARSRRVGRVIAQSPGPGAKRPAGTRVNLVVGRR